MLYGADTRKRKFVNWAIQQLKQKKTVRAVTDHTRTPTLIDDIAAALLTLVRQQRQGIFHVAGPDRLSSYEMALKIAAHYGFQKSLVKPVKAASLQQEAKRPQDSSLDTGLLHKIGIQMSGFGSGLTKMGDIA